jgi:hypothetical protein
MQDITIHSKIDNRNRQITETYHDITLTKFIKNERGIVIKNVVEGTSMLIPYNRFLSFCQAALEAYSQFDDSFKNEKIIIETKIKNNNNNNQ